MEPVRGFYITEQKQLWNEKYLDEIMIGLYFKDGGTKGEFAVRWYDINNKPVPRLEVYADSFNALNVMHDLIEGLDSMDKDNWNSIYFTPEQLIDLLLSLGFEEMSEQNNV